ncbi:MAG: O-antigen ligase family protein [Proteobacteria bacterium]|nr:O-antigen ligase family protein [Pseudomonadota bacterium]
MLACLFALLGGNLLLAISCDRDDMACLIGDRIEGKIVWPLLSGLAVMAAVASGRKLSIPTHVKWLIGYLALAGVSTAWSATPTVTAIRFLQQSMIVTSIVVPALALGRSGDMMRDLFLCCALGTVVNVLFVLNQQPTIIPPGYPGLFTGKNILGQFAAVAFLLSVLEVFRRDGLRATGLVVGALAGFLLVVANSKTALGTTIIIPVFAAALLIVRRMVGLRPSLVLLGVLLLYWLISSVTSLNVYRLSYTLYGDSSFTGRTSIWDFVGIEIMKHKWIGWGYRSFWLSGPDAPSLVDGWGWVKTMPHSHNGYLDTILDTGYLGYAVMMIFIGATVDAIGRIVDHAPVKSWIMMSLALYVMCHNGLESTWFRGADVLWLFFVYLTAEAARCELIPSAAALTSTTSSSKTRTAVRGATDQSAISVPEPNVQWSTCLTRATLLDGRTVDINIVADDHTGECLAVDIRRSIAPRDLHSILRSLSSERGRPRTVLSASVAPPSGQMLRRWQRELGVNWSFDSAGSSMRSRAHELANDLSSELGKTRPRSLKRAEAVLSAWRSKLDRPAILAAE